MLTLDETKQALLNEARILGHAETKTKTRITAASSLREEGKLIPGGKMRGGAKGAGWFKLAPELADAPTTGPRVRFTLGPLGASEPDDLFRIVKDERYGADDIGVVAFEHPNQRMCPGWVYVEVDSKSGPARKLYVGASWDMLQRL